MREENGYVIFDYPGGELKFHKDLKKYYDLRQVLLAPKKRLEVAIRGIKTAAGAKSGMDQISSELIGLINKKLLPQLASFGIYDSTADDFLETNPGFTEMLAGTKNFIGYSSGVENSFQTWADSEKEKASLRAQQSITGPGYSVISNDWIAHAVYAAKSASVVKKQAAKAEHQYRLDSLTIDQKKSQASSTEISKVAQSTYVPLILGNLSVAFDFIIARYCTLLSQVGEFNLDCLNGIDENRSTKLLDNYDTVPDKERLIYQCLQLCPYNLNIYQVIYAGTYQNDSSGTLNLQLATLTGHTGIGWTPTILEIINYFGLKEQICNFIRESCKFNANSVMDAYQEKLPAINSLATLTGQPSEIIASSLLMNDFSKYLDPYYEIAKHLSEGRLLSSFLKRKFPNVEADLLEVRLQSYLEECHRLKKEDILFYKENCNLDAWKMLSVRFGQTFSSYEDIDNYIFGIWKEEIPATKIRETEVQIGALKCRLDEAKALFSDTKKGTPITLIFFVGGLVLVGTGLWGLSVLGLTFLVIVSLAGGVGMMYIGYAIEGGLKGYLIYPQEIKDVSRELSEKTALLDKLTNHQNSETESINASQE